MSEKSQMQKQTGFWDESESKMTFYNTKQALSLN